MFFIPIVHEKPKKLGLVHLIRTNLSLCILFLVFALLNLRLHRRVKLLVLASSLLEFRVLVISCHAAAAPSSSPIYHFCLSATALNPYPYTTTDSYPYPYTTTATTTAAIYHHHISTTNPSSLLIRFVFEIHLVSDSFSLPE